MEYKLYLSGNNDPFTISSKWKMFDYIDTNIRNELEMTKQYKLKVFVSKESLELFLNFLEKGKEKQEINDYNKYELYLLHDEFGFLDYSTQSIPEKMLENIKILKGHSNSDISETQENVAKNLDQYLLECSDDLFQIPIQSLNNIFSHPERNLTNHNFCYNLILRCYRKYNDKNIFILLPYLDGNKLNDESLKDALVNCKNRIGFIPNVENRYISELSETVNQMQKEQQNIDEMEKQIFNSQKMLIDQLIEENENLNDNNEEIIFESEILKLRNEFEEKLKSQKEESENKIKLLESQIEFLKGLK